MKALVGTFNKEKTFGHCGGSRTFVDIDTSSCYQASPPRTRRGPSLYCTALYCTVLYCTVLYCTGQVPRRGPHGAADGQAGGLSRHQEAGAEEETEEGGNIGAFV